MENSQGDKVPSKTEIGPPLPPAGVVGLGVPRESQDGEISGEPNNLSGRSPESDDAQQEVLCPGRSDRRSSTQLAVRFAPLEAKIRGLAPLESLLESINSDLEALTGDAEETETVQEHVDATTTTTTSTTMSPENVDTTTATMSPENVDTTTSTTVSPENVDTTSTTTTSTSTTVSPSERETETLPGDTDALRASFSQDFSQLQPRHHHVPELPALGEPGPWQSGLRAPPTGGLRAPPTGGLLEMEMEMEIHSDVPVKQGDTSPPGCQVESEGDSSPFEMLMMPPAPFEYDEAFSAAPTRPEEEQQAASSSSAAPTRPEEEQQAASSSSAAPTRPEEEQQVKKK
ncbi:mucin-2-like [Engraulis encrasicolus]|uniref:mucin-2-like n=1 Tax=Engraulis encrasicolus TaxID=184585 RepID=UPI002FD19213